MNTLKLEIEVEDQFLDDILINSIECGYSGYWAGFTEYKSEVPSFKIREEDEDWIEGDPVEPWILVDRAFILKGIATVLKTDFSVCTRIRNYILTGAKENDAGNIDAECTDVILQAALLGELTYG